MNQFIDPRWLYYGNQQLNPMQQGLQALSGVTATSSSTGTIFIGGGFGGGGGGGAGGFAGNISNEIPRKQNKKLLLLIKGVK